jgi:hypothetical protein
LPGPTDLLYAHRGQSFAYTAEDCRFIRANLAERVKLFGQILPWDDPNYGTDPWWAMCRPWEQHVKAGGTLAFDVAIMNHSSAPRMAACRAVPPPAWGGAALPPASTADTASWAKAEIPAKTEGRVRLDLPVPQGAKPGTYVVPVDLVYGMGMLPQFIAATVVIEPK